MDAALLGTLITGVGMLGGGVGWLLARREARRAKEPRIVFGDLFFAGSEISARPAYRYAIGVHLTNVGGGPALNVNWGFVDPEERSFAELVHRVALTSNESTDDWSGISNADRQDPPENEARGFDERCVVFAECWDSRGDHYIFWPYGGGRAPDIWDWGDAKGMREFLARFPSRGELPRSLGTGKFTERDPDQSGDEA